MTHLQQTVVCDPGILGGTPVFAGTRVPVQNLIACLEAAKRDLLEVVPA
jgi:uncharacterized protein (DUF433 family)